MKPRKGDQFTGLLIPGGLVHAHIHLDKCFLLDKTPIRSGTFEEALEHTAKAKASFTKDDLYQRGSKLIEESLKNGVVTMRSFVEVDPIVSLICLEVGLQLQKNYKSLCDIQLVIFAQDPLFYPDELKTEQEMMKLIIQACEMTDGETVLGSTPYVEKDPKAQRKNIQIMFDLAGKYGRHLDFHLDYNLDSNKEALIWYVLEQAHQRNWKKSLTISHATRLSLLDNDEWSELANQCKGLEIAFIALPPSDLYMQGRDTPYSLRNRATLPLLELHKRNVCCALAVNNVGNLFTPQGDSDPLTLLPLMVAIWQSATKETLEALLVSITLMDRMDIMAKTHLCEANLSLPSYFQLMVTLSARRAINAGAEDKGKVENFKVVTLNVLENGEVSLTKTSSKQKDYVLLADCFSVQEAVLNPSPSRLAVKKGKLVAYKLVDSGILG